MALSPHTVAPVLSIDEVLRIGREAAAAALRPPMYGPSDRADCAADIIGAALADLAADKPHRHGPAADVLRYIGRAERDPFLRERAAATALPAATDGRFTFSALRNAAHDWRRADTARRDREAMSGPGEAAPAAAAPANLAAYLQAAAAQPGADARRAAAAACERIGQPTGTDAEPSPALCLLYQWVRDIEPEQAAAELGIGWAAWRKRTSRAAAQIRGGLGVADLAAALMGGEPVQASRPMFTHRARHESGRGRQANGRPVETGEWLMVLADEPERAGHSLSLAPDWRDGSAPGGSFPVKPMSAADARSLCTVTHQAPDPDAPARRAAAAAGREADRITAQGHLALGAAISASTGRMPKSATGRTAGKPAEKYAPRSVRLGDR